MPAVYSLHVNQEVQTPNGPGVIQGRMVKDGKTLIIVAHTPNHPLVAKCIKDMFIKGVWVRWNYPLEQITPFVK